MPEPTENPLTPESQVLLIRTGGAGLTSALEALASSFFGRVLVDAEPTDLAPGTVIYAAGDLAGLSDEAVVAVESLSTNIPSGLRRTRVGQVPHDVHGVGVLYPRFFDDDDLFGRIEGAHAFQHLTESTKPSVALRRGIYLTDVRPEGDGDALAFRLLRCSSNLTGPTDNLRAVDREVIDALNTAANQVFARPPALNHVLAQIYDNHRDPDTNRERKAKIGAHSDKTKDMADDAVMAFCSFYDMAAVARLDASPSDPYDAVHKNRTGLTQLYFKRKNTVTDASLVPEFTVTLYPNSVLLIPLSTNRLYTHAIRPSVLGIDRVPTRMGYVVRCSGREALHQDGRTYIRDADALIPLQPMDVAGARQLRETYREENTTDARVDYARFAFSMNSGDYLRPLP